MSQSNIAVGVTLGLYGGPSGIFKIRCVKFAVTLFLLSQLRHTEHWRGMAMLRVLWDGDQTKTVSELNIKVGRVCLCVRWFNRFTTPLSHGSVLLPRLVDGCASGRRTQGWSQGAEEASQQCETEAPPGTKHGPAIAMANVFREAIHVARITG